MNSSQENGRVEKAVAVDTLWNIPPQSSNDGLAAGYQDGASRGNTGESLRQSSGALSAPPPPGFSSGAEERNRQVHQLLPRSPVTQDSTTAAMGNLRPSNENEDSRHKGQATIQGVPSQGGRSSSFINLAAVLGTGLAESMDDATKAEGGRSNWTDGTFDPSQDLNYARQSRHTAARLIGAAPSTDPLGLEPGFAATSNLAGPETSSLLAGLNTGRVAKGSDEAFSAVGQKGLSSGTDHSGIAGYLTDTFSPTSYRTFGANGDDPLTDFSASIRGRGSLLGVSSGKRPYLPASKDLGVTVMEPPEQTIHTAPRKTSTASGTFQRDGDASRLNQYSHEGFGDPSTNELEQGIRNMWIPRDDGTVRSNAVSYLDQSIGNSSGGRSSLGSETSLHQTENELRPFLWDTRNPDPSRCLVILRGQSLHPPEVRSICEAFGVLEMFRSDFVDRGVFFVSYYDMRSAQYAALQLENALKERLHGSIQSHDLKVKYCVPLNSSSQTDESTIVLSDVPVGVDETSLAAILTSYGGVRSLRQQGGYYGGSSFEVEFHNSQDAKQALLELSSTQAFGPDVAVEVGMRPPVDRKRGRDLLNLIGRWRHGVRNNKFLDQPGASIGAGSMVRPGNTASPHQITTPPDASRYHPSDVDHHGQGTRMVLGPDGRYSYVVVNNSMQRFPPPYDQGGQSHLPPAGAQRHQKQIIHGPAGQVFVTPSGLSPPRHQQNHGGYRVNPHNQYWQQQPPGSQQHHISNSGSYVHQNSQPPMYYDGRDRSDMLQKAPPDSTFYPHSMSSPIDARNGPRHRQQPFLNNQHHSSSTGSHGGDEKDNKHLILDLDAVESGRDTRTSLMVRNIPNKYTQQMLLAEFTENGLGPGTIDFFYLPIDFKNRCNRGYAFINFVDFKDILPFHRRYFGKHWSTFNSDKICDITYARIQGKAAMLKRFENSALMEKDEEYKPLVFVSHGAEKGRRLPFAEATHRH